MDKQRLISSTGWKVSSNYCYLGIPWSDLGESRPVAMDTADEVVLGVHLRGIQRLRGSSVGVARPDWWGGGGIYSKAGGGGSRGRDVSRGSRNFPELHFWFDAIVLNWIEFIVLTLLYIPKEKIWVSMNAAVVGSDGSIFRHPFVAFDNGRVCNAVAVA